MKPTVLLAALAVLAVSCNGGKNVGDSTPVLNLSADAATEGSSPRD